jgi:hypothetical protein
MTSLKLPGGGPQMSHRNLPSRTAYEPRGRGQTAVQERPIVNRSPFRSTGGRRKVVFVRGEPLCGAESPRTLRRPLEPDPACTGEGTGDFAVSTSIFLTRLMGPVILAAAVLCFFGYIT